MMDRIPDTAQPDHAQVQDYLPARDRPRHPRAFEPLRKDNFTGHLGGLATDGPEVTSVGLKAHPTTAPVQIRIDLGLVPRPRWCRKAADDGKTRATPLARDFHCSRIRLVQS